VRIRGRRFMNELASILSLAMQIIRVLIDVIICGRYVLILLVVEVRRKRCCSMEAVRC